jgi:NTP pyrophosphatase (non-canonical NTP hydrolase)
MGYPTVGELTFEQFREANIERCEAVFHPIDSWSATDWATALAGEVGELCNLLKKRRRGEAVKIGDLADEIGDVLAYLDLLAAHLGINLEQAAVDKFNVVSKRRGSDIMLPQPWKRP